MNTRRGKWTRGWHAVALIAIACFGAPALADTRLCPAGPIQLIVPWPAGGGTDIQARAVAEPLSRRLGKQIVVVNRPGAGGIVGTTSFLNSARPDGCTLLLATKATNTIAPHIYKDVHFDLIKDFTPIAFIASVPNVLYVSAKSNYHSAQDVIDAARASPGKLAYGSGGIGASTHLSAALLGKLAGLDMLHVPYQGAPQALAGLLGGQVDISVDTAAQVGHVRSGMLRPLAVAARNRLEALPDVPTFDEVGVKGLYFGFWGSIAGPRNLPDGMVKELNEAVVEVMKDPKVRKYFVENGGEIEFMTPAQLKDFWLEEFKNNKAIVELAGVQPS